MTDSFSRVAPVALAALAGAFLHAETAYADAPTGAPPPDATALVSAPSATAKAPDLPDKDKLDVTTVAVSAGGQLSTGNSRLLAGTASGDYETRFSDNGVGVTVLGNYGESQPPGAPRWRATAANIQGRVRYDRYLLDPLSVFLINTVRHDYFQGLDVRYNLDPGVKYLFVMEDVTKLWGELGYDFQYDDRNDHARDVVLASTGYLPQKTITDHSVRAYVGFTHAFNDSVNLNTGLEYLQSIVDASRYRVNFDALFAAKLGGGLALGASFSARFDHQPLPEKKQLDTQSTLSLIYSFSDAPTAKPPAPPPCAPVPACTTSSPPVPTAPPTSQPSGVPSEPPPPSGATPPPPSGATPAPPPAAAPTSPPEGVAPATP
ncbi:MAG TPA: DUF481 domain-containing protein [Polyangiaceae bacterium]|nr:DUF481 domain-containing protein [Polyangiaceae bacterium]